MTNRARRRATAARLRFSVLSGLASCVLGATACGAPSATTLPTLGDQRIDILRGTASDASQDFVVQILLGNGSSCTGFLVAPDIVLTSQHCVVEDEATPPASRNCGCYLGTTPYLADEISEIDVGAAAPFQKFSVAKVYVDESNTDCSKDVAALVLTQPVPDITLHPLLLDSLPPEPEAMTQVGWGCTSDDWHPATIRQQASGQVTEVNGVGTAVTPVTHVSVSDQVCGLMAATTLSCDGDSGGPWIDGSGTIIGVLDQIISGTVITFGDGGMVQSTPSDSVSLAAPLQPVSALITAVFQAQGRMPWRYPQASPPANVGEPCSADNECNSNACYGKDGAGICVVAATPDGGLVANSDAGASGSGGAGGASGLNDTPATQPAGCSVSGASSRSSQGTAWGIALLVALSCGVTRRRSRVRAALRKNV